MEQEIKDLLEKLGVDKEIFNEDLIKQISLVIEAKVGERKTELEESLEESNREELAQFKDDLVDKLDEYMEYWTTDYLEENKEEITNAVEVSTARKVLEKFHGMVEMFNMELSEDYMDNEDELDESKEHVNTLVNENIKLVKELQETQKDYMVAEYANRNISIGSEKAGFVKLAENFEYEDITSFKEKLDYLKENIHITESFNSGYEDSETLENQRKTLEESHLDEDDNNEVADDMKTYLKVFGKQGQ